MRGLADTIVMMALSLSLPLSASAAPLFLHCRGTREVANIVGGPHVSFPVVEFLKIDPDDHLFAEADKSGGPWVNQCDQGGYDCRFDQASFSLKAEGPAFKLTTSINRVARRYRRESENGALLTLSYGSCEAVANPDLPDARRF
jgi:hypothetical protein